MKFFQVLFAASKALHSPPITLIPLTHPLFWVPCLVSCLTSGRWAKWLAFGWAWLASAWITTPLLPLAPSSALPAVCMLRRPLPWYSIRSTPLYGALLPELSARLRAACRRGSCLSRPGQRRTAGRPRPAAERLRFVQRYEPPCLEGLKQRRRPKSAVHC